MKDQLIELETRLTHMDDTVEQLNDIVSSQQQTIDRLEKTLKALVQEHSEIKSNLGPEIVDSKPPHY